MTVGCPECGALEDIPPLRPRMLARCSLCHIPLERTGGRSLGAALACALATFLFLIPANLAPLMTASVLGAHHTSVLGSGIVFMWERGWVIPAVLLGSFGVVFPLLRFGGLSVVLGALLLRARPAWAGPLYRWVMWLDLWAMPDVFVIGFFIGYERVHQRLGAPIGAGGYCFIAAAVLTMLTRATLDRRMVWRIIRPDEEIGPDEPAISCTACDLAAPRSMEGRPCPRCGLMLRTRKPDAVVRAAALSLAALVFYAPANLYPMTVSTEAGRQVQHRIIDGVRELFQIGLWPFAIVIICTSIVIPLLKLIGMAWFILSVQFRWRERLRVKTHLYRVIDELGRWSNVDVFTLVIFVPLFRFGQIASTRVEPGATAFTLVVFLTMLASRSFDPRLMWDAAEGRLA